MKKWSLIIFLTGVIALLSGCTSTAVMLYVRHKRNGDAHLNYKKANQVRTCLGKPGATKVLNGITMRQYHYRVAANKVCIIQLFYKNGRVSKLNFTSAHANGGPSACKLAKEKIIPCMRRYLVYTK